MTQGPYGVSSLVPFPRSAGSKIHAQRQNRVTVPDVIR
jgi:hypothetical protein